MTSNHQSLFRRLDRLDHHERLATLIAHVRTLAPTEADTLGRELAAGDTQRRLLGLQVVRLRADHAAALAALDDPSLSVRIAAAKLVGRYAPTLPANLLDRVDGVSLSHLIVQVVRRRRQAIAEALVAELSSRDRLHEAARLLPSCSDAFVEARLTSVPWPELAWLRLAKGKPALVCAQLARRFERASRADLVWRRHPPQVWALLCERKPEIVADWIDRFAEADSLPGQLLGDGLDHLLRHLPLRVVAWLARRRTWLVRVGLPKGLLRRARQLDDAALVPLCQAFAASNPAALIPLWSRLPYPRRALLFEAATAEIETARVEWPAALLAVLPTALRDREAARMLELVRATTSGTWRRELLGLRTIEVARGALEVEGKSSQAEERGEAYAALVLASMRSGRGMTETLVWLQRIKNDQDPVRLAVLDALAQVPGHHFVDAEALDAVIAPIFDARDTSYGTRHAAARIGHALLVSRATEPDSEIFALGLSLLERLAGQQGTPDLPQLDRNLPRGAEQAIFEALSPWLEAARSRQQESHIFRVWSALGERAWRVDALGELVAKIIWKGSKSSAGPAANLWLQDPATRDVRVRELVARDRSALYLHPVLMHCHHRRQTLLTERLAKKAPKGRFHDGKVVIVPHLVRGFSRWTTQLQEAYVALIRFAEAEPKHYAHARAGMIALRARVPISRVEDFADALASKKVAVKEAALGALVHTDAPAPALPILLEHLDGDRARVAMYAMPRLARSLPRDKMVEALAELLTRPKLKVTVHKEALRLLGALATPGAVALLREAWQRPLHRDVRIAALHAARSLLGHEHAWQMLESAATEESTDIVRALVEVPVGNVAEPHRARYLEIMFAVADHESSIARAALFGALRSGWTVAGPERAVTVALGVIGRSKLDDPWRSALSTVAEGARERGLHGAIIGLVEALVEQADREVAPAGERDRLAHQRLVALLDVSAEDRHPVVIELLEALAERLLERSDWWARGAALRVAAAANAELASVIMALLEAAPSAHCARAVDDAARSAARLAAREWSPTEAEAIAATLAAGAPAARLVATSWMAELGPRWGWTDSWTEILARLRRDADLDVRTHARAVWLS